MSSLHCRFCDAALRHTVVDLGVGPLVDAYVPADALQRIDPFLPMHVYVCDQCWLVQLPEAASPEQLFGDYPYFSSVSQAWIEHAQRYCDQIAARLALDASSRVVELASNDGYLLQHFKARGIPILGIEPARNVAAAAVAAGIPTVNAFFGVATARRVLAEHGPATLMVGNNVMAHVPDRNDFIAGIALLLAPGGVLTMEFPHLLRTMQGNQFDQIFHEHFSYLSLVAVQRMFARHGLSLFDVDELPTHGGSIRVYAQHAASGHQPVTAGVAALLDRERAFGLESLAAYAAFGSRVRETKWKLLEFLIAAKRAGKRVVAYGAPGKGATLLNYCGVRSDFIDYIVDRSPHKQGLYMPGVRLQILHPDRVREDRPDYLLLLAWNWADEVMAQMAHIREWGGQFVVPIPEVRVVA